MFLPTEFDPCTDNGPCPTDAICEATGDAQVTCVCQTSGYAWNEVTSECSGQKKENFLVVYELKLN